MDAAFYKAYEFNGVLRLFCKFFLRKFFVGFKYE